MIEAGELSKVSAIVSKDLASCLVSTSWMVWLSLPNAGGTSNGVVVRDSGIAVGYSLPGLPGRAPGTSVPSSVLIRIEAVVWSPRSTFFTWNEIRT